MMFKTHLISENLFVQRLRSKEWNSDIDDSNRQVDDINSFESCCNIIVNGGVPHKVTNCWQKQTYFKNFEDHSVQIGSKIIRVRMSPEQIVLIKPVHKEKHDDEDWRWQWGQQAIEACYPHINDVKSIGWSKVKLCILKVLVELVLEKVDSIRLVILEFVNKVED